jgi:hypothetical protein
MEKEVVLACRQVCLAVLVMVLASACVRTSEEHTVMPPPTYPLSQDNLGYGVVIVQYTRVGSEPSDDSFSPGHLRRGSVVRVTQRRLLTDGTQSESWVFVDGAAKGWLRESLLEMYDNQMQAQTAAKSLGR